MSLRFFRFAAPSIALALLGAGCFGSTTGPTGPDGGVWKSVDRGLTWVNKKAYVSGPKVTAAAATFDVLNMVFDPQDRQTMYLATSNAGLVYSLDGGESWQSGNIPKVTRVNDVAVDGKNRCTVYAVTANRILKTDTCARVWKEVFFEARTAVTFTKIIADWYNPTILYAGTSDGDIYKTQDAGASWTKVKRVDGVLISSLAFDPRDSRILYVGTQGDGIWKTTDAGLTWSQIKKQFGDDFRDARRVIQVIPDPVEASLIYLVSRYGIMKSADGGETWVALNLTSPPGTIKINALAIDPKNDKNIVFTGVSTLQFTTDGGVSWTPKKLPTTQVGSALLIDPMTSDGLYLGTTPPPQQ